MKIKTIKEIETRWQNHMMIIAAFRYCLGRQSYICLECVQWLSEWWSEIHKATRDIIIEETEDALANDAAGDVCEREYWLTFLNQRKKKATPLEVTDSLDSDSVKNQMDKC